MITLTLITFYFILFYVSYSFMYSFFDFLVLT